MSPKAHGANAIRHRTKVDGRIPSPLEGEGQGGGESQTRTTTLSKEFLFYDRANPLCNRNDPRQIGPG
jgi:hypothetical protein